jgi:beta-glucosidase
MLIYVLPLLLDMQTAVLAPGAKETVTFAVPSKLLSVWSEAKHEWEAVHGSFGLAVGASSKDLKLHQDLTL